MNSSIVQRLKEFCLVFFRNRSEKLAVAFDPGVDLFSVIRGIIWMEFGIVCIYRAGALPVGFFSFFTELNILTDSFPLFGPGVDLQGHFQGGPSRFPAGVDQFLVIVRTFADVFGLGELEDIHRARFYL